MKEQEHLHEENRKRILSLRLFDNDFMNACFADNIESVQLVVRIILGRDDFQVINVKTQTLLKNLQGRDIWLDIHAKSDSGEEFDVEIQRDDRGANFKRARYHSSMLDAHLLKPADDFNKLPDTYVIFITENDVIGHNRPIYTIERQNITTGKPFRDGSHIIYVNGSNKDSSTALGRLMHDFS
ncbi:MAG: PD-(D/E)XK nuclease family transposase, partial [Lachnospiraceae bacterium]|nr:PD-(D/E)XK nuclease family transposase [Lachnospiraceae bacterium]